MTVAETPERQRPPRPWWLAWWMFVFVLPGAMLLVGAIVLACWLRSDSDLVEVRAYAVSKGLPLEWPAERQQMIDPVRLAAWERAVAAKKALQSWCEVDASNHLPKIGEAVPEALRQHHASLDQQQVQHLFTALAEVGPGPLVQHAEISFETLMPEVSDHMAISRFLMERELVASPDELMHVFQAHVNLITCRDLSCLIEHLVSISALNHVTAAVSANLVNRAAILPIADTLILHADNLLSHFADSLIGEMRSLHLTTERIQKKGTNLLSSVIDSLNIGDGKPLLNLLMMRTGRRPMLVAYVDLNTALRQCLLDHPGDEISFIRTLATVGGPFDESELIRMKTRWWLHPQVLLFAMMTPALGKALHSTRRTSLHLRLLAAELRGEPWPVDVFDPALGRLRRIERDGKMIAAYSVGADGRDDGGDPKKDFVFELYGSVGP